MSWRSRRHRDDAGSDQRLPAALRTTDGSPGRALGFVAIWARVVAALEPGSSGLAAVWQQLTGTKSSMAEKNEAYQMIAQSLSFTIRAEALGTRCALALGSTSAWTSRCGWDISARSNDTDWLAEGFEPMTDLVKDPVGSAAAVGVVTDLVDACRRRRTRDPVGRRSWWILARTSGASNGPPTSRRS